MLSILSMLSMFLTLSTLLRLSIVSKESMLSRLRIFPKLSTFYVCHKEKCKQRTLAYSNCRYEIILVIKL